MIIKKRKVARPRKPPTSPKFKVGEFITNGHVTNEQTVFKIIGFEYDSYFLCSNGYETTCVYYAVDKLCRYLTAEEKVGLL